MNFSAGIDKQRLVFGIYLLVLIVVAELILHSFHLPPWPVFMIMIFFFEAHMNKERAPHLLLGALMGIACFWMAGYFIGFAAPMLGVWGAKLLFICLVVYSIVALGEMLPFIFNNYAFMFFLVSGLAARMEGVAPDPLLWMIMAVVGGGCVIVAILGIGQLMAKMAGAGETEAEANN